MEFVTRDIRCVVLRAGEPAMDRIGIWSQPVTRWWCRRLDAGHEGYFRLGPEGTVDATSPP